MGQEAREERSSATGMTLSAAPLDRFVLEKLWWSAVALGNRGGCRSEHMVGLEECVEAVLEDGHEKLDCTLLNVIASLVQVPTPLL